MATCNAGGSSGGGSSAKPKVSKEGITTTKSKSGTKIVSVGPTGKLTSTQIKRMTTGTTINFGTDWRFVKMGSNKWRVFKNGKRQADRTDADIAYVTQ